MSKSVIKENMPYYLESWCNLNYFFFLLVIFSIIFGAFEGNLPEVSRAALEESSHAVILSLELLGMLCFWGGLMEAAKRSGLTEKICFALLPVLGTIFPRLRKEKAALGAISMNITANMLGLGNAATPLGIAAMKELKSISAHGCTASKEMVCFVVMNTASLQILPTTVAILRMEAGANRPLDILPAVWIVSLCSLFIGICVAKFSYRGGAQK